MLRKVKKKFLYFNYSDPGSVFTIQNAFGFIFPSSCIYLKTDNLYWSIYNYISLHLAFANNIFNSHYGFNNKLILKYFFYNILKNKAKYKNSLLLNYNYIYNKEKIISAASKIVFPKIVWLFKNNNSTIGFDVTILPLKKNKLRFNFLWTLNDAESTTIKNYNQHLLKQKNLINQKYNNLFVLASLNNSNYNEINQTMLELLEADRINENQSNTINNSNFIIKKKKKKNKKNEKNLENKSKKQIDLERKKKKNSTRYRIRIKFAIWDTCTFTFSRIFYN